jgi:hypothetical protein
MKLFIVDFRTFILPCTSLGFTQQNIQLWFLEAPPQGIAVTSVRVISVLSVSIKV